MKFYTLTAYLDDVKVGYGTVLEDHTVDILISEANDWFGKDRWNRLELTRDEETVE
jgi:hypothetical protein